MIKINKWKLSAIILGLLWLTTSAWFAFQALGQGISYTYLEQSYSDLKQSNDFLGKLVVAGSKEYSKVDILHLLRQASPDSFIVNDESTITLESTSFHFKNDILVKVQYQHGT